MRKLIVFVIGVMMAIIPAGFCQADEGKAHVCFRVVDADKDGEVSREEFGKYFDADSEKFKAADSDANGTLTHDEYHSFLGHGAS